MTLREKITDFVLSFCVAFTVITLAVYTTLNIHDWLKAGVKILLKLKGVEL